MKKVCTKCKIEKDKSSFSARKIAKDGLASWCRDCFKKNWKKRYYKNHEHYRKRHNKSRKKIREKNARKVFEYLKKNPCLICGESDPIVLEFDHREDTEKIESISNLILNSNWKKIKNEINKCDVLCANCHRRRTAKQFGYRRHLFKIS